MERLDQFELRELIGAGGMARVYRALDTRLDREVALKLLDPVLASRPNAAHRFQREARLAAGLRHPNVVAVYDCSPEGSPHWYLVTELVEGGSLRKRIGQGLLAEEAALLLLPVARALAAAHRHGIIHRDVKPDNILVDRGEQGATIKLADFGVAVALFEPRVTTDGAISGSLAYLAPEILHGEPVSPSADVWSFGVTFFELVHGRLPFGDVLLQAVAKGPIQVDTTRVPVGLTSLMQACLQREPQRRPQDGSELAAKLERVLAECGLEHPEEELARWGRDADYSQKLQQRLADRLVVAATKVSLPERADLLDRALALMPGHAGALSLLEAGGQSLSAGPLRRIRFRRTAWLWVSASLVATLIAAIALSILSRRHTRPSAGPGSTVVVVSRRDRAMPPSPDPASPRSPPLGSPPDFAQRRGSSAEADSGSPRRHEVRAATLQLTTEPWAEVTLDGRSIGHTPKLHRIPLPPGEHRLRLQNPLCRAELLKLKVRPGELLVRHVRLEVLSARVTLRGPAGWKVFLDGRPLGVLPLPVVNVEHGEHKLRAVTATGESRERRFRATAGQNQTLDLSEEQ